MNAKTTVDLGEGVVLDARTFTTSAMAIIGKRGRGKSGLLKRLIEEMLRCGKQVVIFDPMGIMWGILSSFRGDKASGFRVLVIGGKRAHIPLERTAGRKIARAIVESGVSCIIDFSKEPKNAYRQFMAEFADEIFHANKSPIHVIIEEANELVPQRVPKDRATTYEAVERLMSKGRNNGIGVTIVSQRSATVNKDVLSQADTLTVLGMMAPTDREAMEEWFREQVDEEGGTEKFKTFVKGLARLKTQHAWFWSPEKFNIFTMCKVRDFTTFHPDATHLEKLGVRWEDAKLTDCSDLIAKMSDEVKRLRKNLDDLAELRRYVGELEKQLIVARKGGGVDPKEFEKAVAEERRKVAAKVTEAQEQVLRLEREVERRDKALARMGSLVTGVKMEMDQVLSAVDEAEKRRASSKATQPAARIPTTPPTVARPRGLVSAKTPTPQAVAERLISERRKVADGPMGGDTDSPPQPEDLDRSEVAVLLRIVHIEKLGFSDPPREQVALWSGYSASGGRFANILGRLKATGMVEYPLQGHVRATDSAKEFVEDAADDLPDQDKVIEVARTICDPSEMKVLDAILTEHPDPIARADLAEKTGYDPTGGRFANIVGALRTKGLVVFPQQGYVAANKLLFMEE